MAFWLTALGLAIIVAAFLVLALLRGRRGAAPAAAYDLQVYRDQLAEVDRDRARGLLSAEDAERARVEISRRILEADRALQAARDRSGGAARGATLVAAGLVAATVVGGAAYLYVRIGAPGMRDLPLEGRIEAIEEARAERPGQAEAEAARPEPPADRLPEGADESYLDLVARLRARVAEAPDAEGYALLTRHEAALGRFRAAYRAMEQFIALRGDHATGQDMAEQAELMILAAGGYVSPEAEEVLKQSLARSPGNPTARYYSGLMFAQAGRFDMAFRLWQRLLQEGPPDAPWLTPIRNQIGEVARLAGERFDPRALRSMTAMPGGTPGPSAEDIEAAGEMDAADRTEMIRGMVAGLAERLSAEGGPPADWARLITSYAVLGEADKARKVLDDARAAHGDDPAALAVIGEAAKRAGLDG